MGNKSAFQFLFKLNPKYLMDYHKRCINNFGFKFMTMMFTGYFFTAGFMQELLDRTQFPFYQKYNFLSTEYTLNKTITDLPSSFKSALGVLSDVFPLLGYYKSGYMALTAILGFISITIFLALPDNLLFSFQQLPALLLAFLVLEAQSHDLYLQGKFAEKMVQKPNSKADLVTFSMFYQTIGKIIPAIFIGPWASSESLNVKDIFFFALPITIHPLIPLYFNCMVDDKCSPDKKNKLDYNKIKKYGKIIILAFAISLSACISLVIALVGSSSIQFVYVIIAASFLALLAFYSLPALVARANFYIFLCDLVYLNIQGPLDYWFTADEDCVPGGPKFSLTYYITYVTILKTLCNCLGIILFQVWFTGWKLRHIYWTTTALRIIASLSDIIIINRWNLLVGIPDQIFFLIGNTIIFQTTMMMDLMPSNIMIAKVCPKKLETCIFSILAGFANYGLALAGFIGIYIQEALNVYGSIERGCNYENMVLLIFICNIIGPFLNIFNTFWLIPDGKVTDDFIKDFYDTKNLGFYKDSKNIIIE